MAVLLTNSIAIAGHEKTISMLKNGSSSLDAIEEGIKLVESDPGAGWVGYGGHPNLLGKIELDAGIIDGSNLHAGAVGALSGYSHPISVARKVMEELPHVLLVGDGACRFAKDCHAEEGENMTPKTRSDWENWLEENRNEDEKENWPNSSLIRLSMLTACNKTAKGTTIFLAQDNKGNISAGSSTSGWSFKYPGRLGDSPVIGSGIYADNRYGAAACTGMGELTIRSNTARSVILYMKMNMSLRDACYEALNDLRDIQTDFRGGVSIYAIDKNGEQFVVSVNALEKGLPECDPYYWYWSDSYKNIQKISAVCTEW